MTIFKHTLKRLFTSKVKMAVLLLMPILFSLMFVMIGKTAVTIAVVDRDNSILSHKLVSSLSAVGNVKVTMTADGELDDRIISFQADYALIIPEGFGRAIVNGGSPKVGEFYLIEKEKLFYVRAFVNSYVADMKALAAGANHDGEKFAAAFAAYGDGALTVLNASTAQDKIPQSRGALGFLVQAMLYMSVITAGIILEDRSSGVYYRTFFAPVSLRRYFAENLLAFLIVGALQVVFVLTALRFVFGLSLGVHPLATYALYTVFALACVTLGMWLITMFRKPIYAYVSIVFLVTPFVMLGGCYWPSSFMPDVLVKISKFMPTTWVMQAVDKILSNGAALGGIGLELLVVLLFAAVFLAAGLGKKVEAAK